MPKKKLLPEYETDQAVELIRQHIHNRIDRDMLYLRLIDGLTYERIAQEIYLKYDIRFEVKTVRTHINKGEDIIFAHIPG